MAFYAFNFEYDNIPCEKFGLFLISPDANGVITSTGSGSVELYTQEVYRRPTPYLFGTKQSPVLEFDLSFASFEKIDFYQQTLIQRWLLGQSSYKKLKIAQIGMSNFYFNCLFTEPTFTNVGNFAYTMTVHAICDSPFAWEEPTVWTTTATNSNADGVDLIINNESDLNDYVYPKITVALSNDSTGEFTITNKSLTYANGNYETFAMNGLVSNETITIDCDLGIISTNHNAITNRYKNIVDGSTFLRLKPYFNTINIKGDCIMTISYQNARRVSA